MKKLPAVNKLRAGFTLIEMLVVLGIIAIIVSFALPKFLKSIGKAKVTDAVQALAAASAQAESICATKGASTTPSANIFGEAPGGYTIEPITGTCGAKLTLTLKSSDLPTLSIIRCTGTDAGKWKYAATYPSTAWSEEDIPVPSDKMKACL